MTWVRIEDTFPEHPKVDRVGGDAAWLHVCALAYCNRNETDGFIAAERISRLSDRKSPKVLAVKLVDVGLWELEDDGWRIHDYLHYQPSRESLERKRQDARNRMRSSREQSSSSPDVRANKLRSSPNPTPTHPDPSITSTNNSHPVPTERPEGEPVDKLTAVATAYAKIALERAVNVGNQAAYRRKAHKTALEHPDIGRFIHRYPTAPPDSIAAWLHGELGTMTYFPNIDELASVTPLRPA